jgi:FixJ family two-component response regulator
MTLAIVDDDDDVRTAVARLLRAMGHQVRAFASAEDFDRAAVDVDCAILDVRLLGISGVDLGERLRGRTPPVPVVLITGDGEWLARDVPRTTNMPLVTKPFDDVTLSSAIAQATSCRGTPDRHAV